MDAINSITPHISYRCARCQMGLLFGPMTGIDKKDFIFREVDGSCVNMQPSGLFCGILGKMKVTCGDCGAKLGYTDKSRSAYKIRAESLHVIIKETRQRNTSKGTGLKKKGVSLKKVVGLKKGCKHPKCKEERLRK